MATEETQTAHPGDIIQDSEGLLYLVAETHGWGVGAVLRWRDPRSRECDGQHYRFKPGQFVVVGVGHLLPEEVAQARRDSLTLAAELAREQRAAQTDEPVEVVCRAGGWFVTGKNWSGPWNTEPAAQAAMAGNYDAAHALHREGGR